MSDSDGVDDIREQKRKELLNQAQGDDSQSSRSPDEPVHVEDTDHFSELTGDGVVLADFYADWCAPCRQLEPIVENIAADTSATVAKVDVDKLQQLAQQYGVRGVPTMVLFSDGEAVERMVGVRGESQIRNLVESYA